MRESGRHNKLINRREMLRATGGLGVTSVFTMGSATAQQQQKIQDWHDLNAIRNNLNGNYILVESLDKNTQGYNEYIGSSQVGWKPISGNTDSGELNSDNVFTGSFDGNGHTIRDLQIDGPYTYTGLFGAILDSSISNINIKDFDITGSSAVGSLAGVSLNSEITSIFISGKVSGTGDVGGIVCYLTNSEVNDASSEIDISHTVNESSTNGEILVGGLAAAVNKDSTIKNSSARGNISVGESSKIGGLVGSNSGSIINSLTTTEISANDSDAVGGLVGENGSVRYVEDEEIVSGQIKNSLSHSRINGLTKVGGLVGKNSSKVSQSSVTGDVDGISEVGGLVGINDGGIIKESHAKGDVVGEAAVGGLVGLNLEGSEIGKSSSAGSATLTGDSLILGYYANSLWAGGLVGGNLGNIRASASYGDVVGEKPDNTGAVGGIVGKNDGNITNSFATGDIDGKGTLGGIVGSYNDSFVSNRQSSTIYSSYWNEEKSNVDNAVGYRDGGEVKDVSGLLTEEMQGELSKEHMSTLDFEETWDVSDTYPTLAWQSNDEQGDESEQSTPGAGFDPARHGFGFPNWPGNFGMTVGGEQFEYEDDGLTREAVQRAMVEDWAVEVENLLWSMLSRVFYSYLSSEAATNGHCYGMVFAAEEYFSDPNRLPDAADTASDVPKPTGDYASVGDLIREYQTSQIISTAGPFFTNRALVNNSIDTAVAISELKTALDQSGTAGVSFYSSETGGIHDVLAYDYQEREDSLEIAVYDPNNPADSGDTIDESYATAETADPVTSFEVDSESGAMERGYKNDLSSGVPVTYDRWAFSRPGLSLEATEAMTGDTDQYLSQFRQGLFVGLNSPARLNIDAPADSTVVHPNTPVDASTTDGYHDFAYIVDATPGAYNVTVTGTGSGEYALELYGIQGDESVIAESVSGTITTNQVDDVNIELGTSEAETSIEINRDVDTETEDGTVIFGFTIEEVAVGGVASVAMAYATVRMLSDDRKGE